MGPRGGSTWRTLLRPLGLCFALAALVLAASAIADTTTVRDKRNTRLNRFDIKSATAGHSGALLEHTISTYRKWRPKELRSTEDEPRMICVYIWRAKSDPNEQQDYQVCADYKDGKLEGSVYHVRPPRKRTGKIFIHRFGPSSIVYRFDKKSIGNPRRYQWKAVTGYTGRGCPKDPPFQFGCDDSAPSGAGVVKVHTLTGPPPPSTRHESSG
jgi:hypothetical protein